MSKEQQLSHRSGGNDKDCHFTTSKHFHRGDEETDEESDKEIEEDTIKISKAQDLSLAPSGLIHMIDTYDRPGSAKAEGGYAQQGSYSSEFENKPGKRIPKAGVYAEAGDGRAQAKYSVFEAEAKGPNASIGAMARGEVASALNDGELEVKFLGKDIKNFPNTSFKEAVEEAIVVDRDIVRFDVASVSTKAGPVGVKVGIGFDTGVSAGLGGVEAKFLGTGFSVGPKTSVALLGSEVSCSVM